MLASVVTASATGIYLQGGSQIPSAIIRLGLVSFAAFALLRGWKFFRWLVMIFAFLAGLGVLMQLASLSLMIQLPAFSMIHDTLIGVIWIAVAMGLAFTDAKLHFTKEPQK